MYYFIKIIMKGILSDQFFFPLLNCITLNRIFLLNLFMAKCLNPNILYIHMLINYLILILIILLTFPCVHKYKYNWKKLFM